MNIATFRQLVGAECRRLAKLSTPQAIAKELASRGIQGYVDSIGNHCPLARVISDTLCISTGNVRVTHKEVILMSEDSYLHVFKGPTQVLSEFVRAFDDGHFPALQTEDFESRRHG